jgi:hypothetical protein
LAQHLLLNPTDLSFAETALVNHHHEPFIPALANLLAETDIARLTAWSRHAERGAIVPCLHRAIDLRVQVTEAALKSDKAIGPTV